MYTSDRQFETLTYIHMKYYLSVFFTSGQHSGVLSFQNSRSKFFSPVLFSRDFKCHLLTSVSMTYFEFFCICYEMLQRSFCPYGMNFPIIISKRPCLLLLLPAKNHCPMYELVYLRILSPCSLIYLSINLGCA